MQLKKHPNADLEKKRPVLLPLSLLVVLSFTMMAFEWRSFNNPEQITVGDNWEVEEDYVLDEDFKEKVVVKKKTKTVSSKKLMDLSNVVETDIKVKDEFLEDEIVNDDDVDHDFVGECDDCDDPEDNSWELVRENGIKNGVFNLEKVKYNPQFGGNISKYINDNIHIPEGMVLGTYKTEVKFVVGKNGKVKDIYVVGADSKATLRLKRELIKIFKTMPIWIPGKLEDGTPVNVRMIQPVSVDIR